MSSSARRQNQGFRARRLAGVVLLYVAVAVAANACVVVKPKPTAACAATVASPPPASGLFVTSADPTTSYPEVAALVVPKDGLGLFCTGTWVSSDTVITAAHCLDGVAANGILVSATPGCIDGVAALKTFDHGITDPTVLQADYTKDLAILVFPAGTGTTWATVRQQPAAVADLMTLVGYGQAVLDDQSSADFVKRIGHNTISYVGSGLLEAGGVATDAAGVAHGTESLPGRGDSGGPVYVGGQIAAIDNGVGRVQGNGVAAVAVFNDLTSELSQTLLKSAIAGGATISGVTAP